MTREEAIERLKQNKAAAEFYAGMVQNTNAIENELKDIEAIDMAIEALSQESSEDVISRQAAIDAFLTELTKRERKNLLHTWSTVEVKYFVVDMLEKSPSAQPERKKGRWIPVDSYSAFGGDEATWMAHGNPVAFYYCSECKEQAYAGEDGDSLLTDYCPNCGAKMRGVQDE